MGLLGEVYTAFGVIYSIVLFILKYKDFSGRDLAFMVGTLIFVGLKIGSYINEVCLIPSGYKSRFIGKSLLRELLGPLLSLFYYPILFCCSDCVKRALIFSNEAHDGIEWTRQLDIFELVEIEPGARYNLATHDLLRYEGGNWGYDRRVGEIWVRVRFKNKNLNRTGQRLKLQTSDDGTLFIHIPTLQTTLQDNDSKHESENEHESVDFSVSVSCLECIWGNLERGSIPAEPGTQTQNPSQKSKISADPSEPGTSIRTPLLEGSKIPADLETPGSPAERYEVTITWRREIYRIESCKWLRFICFRANEANENKKPETCCMWNLSFTVDRNWTLFKIHQYMLCLDAWGNHPKQGIWKPTDDLYKYCYRHDELIAAIGNNKRLKQRQNNGTWYTVV